MVRPAPPLVLTDDEREELQRLTKRATVNRLLAFRARLIFACAEPLPNTRSRSATAANETVGKWRQRFVRDRLVGLYDEPRVGAPRTVTDADVEAIIVQTLETQPAGATHWSTRTVAAKTGLSHTVIGRNWSHLRAQGAPDAHVQAVPLSTVHREGAGRRGTLHAPPVRDTSAMKCIRRALTRWISLRRPAHAIDLHGSASTLINRLRPSTLQNPQQAEKGHPSCY